MDRLPIVTISRQYGSGGRFVGRMLAEKLGVPFYDNEIITLASEKSGYSKNLFEKPDQRPTNSLMYSLSLFNNVNASYHMPLNDKVFIIQSDVIRDIADQGPCVIVGRCADYILQDRNCANIFIHSDIEHRINRVVQYYGVEEKNAADTILRTDRKRATYYNYYTDKKWGKSDNYHLSINADMIGIENTVDVLETFVRKFHK